MNYRKKVHDILAKWLLENGLTGDYIVHHRDDTEECRKYNAKDAHYKMWGFNLDGTFEYGKYVVFMTRSDHVTHHCKGKPLSVETKQKMSISHTGIKYSDETRTKLSEMRRGENHWNYGNHWSDDVKLKMCQSHKGFKHSDMSKSKMSESRKGENNSFYGKHHSKETLEHLRELRTQQMKLDSAAYQNYKSNGGNYGWHEFRKRYHNNDPEVISLLSDILYKENIK